jgi:hypothetical protein
MFPIKSNQQREAVIQFLQQQKVLWKAGLPRFFKRKNSCRYLCTAIIKRANREQQAQIVEDFFRLRQNMPINDHASTATRADLPLFGDFVQTVSSLSRAQLMTPI